MKRYYREEDNDLYDRQLRRYITVKTEHQNGDHYYVNEGEEQKVIHKDDVEEKR